MEKQNLFADLAISVNERVELLGEGKGNVRVERIISFGHASPEGFWYDQGAIEWVVLLSGSAMLRFENDPDPIRLVPGDWIEIPAHCRHRVDSTSSKEASVWLAIFWDHYKS